jgi:hypothetical protein
VAHAYLGYDILAVLERLMGIASLSKERSGKCTSVIYSTRYSKKRGARGSVVG